MSESLKEYIYNRIDHHEKHHEYEVATETIRCWIDAYQEQEEADMTSAEAFDQLFPEEPEATDPKEYGLAFAIILAAGLVMLFLIMVLG